MESTLDSSEGTVIVLVQGFRLQDGRTQGGEDGQNPGAGLPAREEVWPVCWACCLGLLNYQGEEHPTNTTLSHPPSCFERFSGTPHYTTLRI